MPLQRSSTARGALHLHIEVRAQAPLLLGAVQRVADVATRALGRAGEVARAREYQFRLTLTMLQQ